MIGMKQSSTHKERNPYATTEDFCRVFHQNLDSLYVLALLLTGDQSDAEKCFVAGFADSVITNRVFKEWAYAWAKIAIIKNAVSKVHPRLDSSSPALIREVDSELPDASNIELHAVLALPGFIRFVFVLSVLEQFTERDSARLLGCSIKELRRSRVRGLELIANSDVHDQSPEPISQIVPGVDR